jgi:hypothetical protein
MDRIAKNAKISGQILTYFANHMAATDKADKTASLRFAINKVLGVGTYEAIAAETYEAMAVAQ